MFKQAYLGVLTLTYDFLKYENTFLKNTTVLEYEYIFVEYDFSKGKYAHTWFFLSGLFSWFV